MNIIISISDEKISNFVGTAQEELKNRISEITDFLIKEACEMESSERQNFGIQEVTSLHVNKAYYLFFKRYKSNKNKLLRNVNKIAASLFPLIDGWLINLFLADRNNDTLLLWALVFFVISAVTTILSIQEKP